jgi:chemotaxis protein methyltransferase CheR
VGKFHRSVRDGGWFIPGLTEILEVYRTKFTPVNFPGAVLYQKSPPVKSKPAIPQHWIETAPLTLLTPGREPACSEVPADAANRISYLKPSPLSGSPQLGPALANPTALPARRAVALGETTPPLHSVESSNGEGTVESLVQRARSLAGVKNLAAAIHCLERALAIDRLNIPAYYVQGMVFLELGELGRALKAFKHTLFLQPEHILAHVNLAQVAGRQNQFRLRDKHLDNAANLLKRLAPDAVVPESDGLSASHLLELITKPPAQELPGEPPK